ncbi:MAG: hypothetical protein JWR45_1088 [Blastococcus sp.]|jgi:hypothetical protein|nr:hypothetical protein [Blastococcus sp.]
MNASPAVAALRNAIIGQDPVGTVVHADRGSHCRSDAFVGTIIASSRCQWCFQAAVELAGDVPGDGDRGSGRIPDRRPRGPEARAMVTAGCDLRVTHAKA